MDALLYTAVLDFKSRFQTGKYLNFCPGSRRTRFVFINHKGNRISSCLQIIVAGCWKIRSVADYTVYAKIPKPGIIIISREFILKSNTGGVAVCIFWL